MLAGLLVFSAFSYTWGDPASLAIFFAATAMIAADARTERENHVVLTDDVEQVGKVAELEYYGTR